MDDANLHRYSTPSEKNTSFSCGLTEYAISCGRSEAENRSPYAIDFLQKSMIRSCGRDTVL